eukprot:TRINITY_DN445_c0_g1_i1.p1 TRINITY_DN445_c0_g1~~TRINITY_DN445_c0_g1_i1.p1  ORF type:complete len:362 (+),score=56.81 TRINITY_DN445_c0_g1_i1:125-1210(+)
MQSAVLASAASNMSLSGCNTNTQALRPSLSSSFFSQPHYLIHRKAKGVSCRSSTVDLKNNLSISATSPLQTETKKKMLPFVKYHGLGNDFILVDNRDSTEPKLTPEQSVKLCHRNFGIGADGVIFAMPGVNETDYTMRIYNSDGSEPEMCGNGIRCMACFVAELDNSTRPHSYTINTGAGLIVPRLQEDGKVRVDMGEPKLSATDIPTNLPEKKGMIVKSELVVRGERWIVTCVSMGNPHCVTFGRKDSEGLDIDELSLKDIGPLFEHHDMFPARTNTEFVEVISTSHLRMKVWERGAGATLACGTGACAVVVAAVLEGRSERKCLVELPGGPLEIEWNENDNHVYMTGPAEKVFSGTVLL